MLKSNIIGIDLVKNILQICQISKQVELISNKLLNRQKLKEVLAKTKPAIVLLTAVEAAITGGGMLSNLVMMFVLSSLKNKSLSRRP
jgi:hypothetical protein